MTAAVLQLDQQHRMTRDDYRRERDRIRITYGESSIEAAASRDQALAELYHRSGWTQEELAKAEGCGRPIITRRIVFGRFLGFVPSGHIPRNLTERAFRSYWEQTDKAEKNDRIRFQAVLRLMEEHTRVGKSTAPKPAVGKAIMDRFADGKWHDLETIEKHVDASAEDVRAVLATMQQRGSYGAHCERKKKGTSFTYQIIRKGSKVIDADVLRTELEPILDKLREQGQANVATFSPSAISLCIVHIQKLVEALAK
jgi:hypothetical protein